MNKNYSIVKILKKIGRWMWFCCSNLPILNFPVPFRLPGGTSYLIYPDEIGLAVLLRRPLELGEQRFISKFLKRGMTFFDIGANQGLYTLLAAKCVGPDGKVFAFEPVPSEFRKLKWNVLVNHFHNVTMEQLTLGCKEGSANMFVCLDGKGSYSNLRPPAQSVRARRKLIQVHVSTLDSYIYRNNIQHIDFIKIDVEGGKLDVIKGGSIVFERLQPIVMCEMADTRTQQWGYNASEIYKFLVEKYGYSWFQITSHGYLVPAKVKERYDPDWENLLGVPTEKLTEISTFRENI